MTGSEMSDSDKEGEDKQKEREGKGKIQRSLKSMLQQMELGDDEIKYRMENFENADVKEYMKYLKCTKCDKNFQKVINQGDTVGVHPLLGVLMCDSCCDYYGDGNFSLDSEGEDKYCRWCGEGGTIFACSKCICGFCDECIKKHFGESELDTVKNDDDWICYFCNPKPLWYLRSICSLVKEAAKNKQDHLKKNKESGSVRKKKRRKKENGDNDTSKGSLDGSSSSSSSSVYRKRKTRTRRTLRFSDRRKAESSSSGDEKENHVNSKKRPVRSKVKDSSDVDGRKDSSESDWGNSKRKSKNNKDEEDESTEKKKKEFLTKLKSIWKLTQTITEVGFSSSKSKLKYLSRYEEFGTEKLQKEYEELKSCMNVLTSSLNTASNSVNSIKDDLISDTTIDETETFRSEEIKLKRFADKFHGGKSNDDVTSVDSEGDSSLLEVKRRREEKKKTSASDGKRKSLKKSVKTKSAKESGTKKNNSVSKLSDSDSETGGKKGEVEKEGSGEEENEEKKCDSDKESVVKPFLKVKSFARMLNANAYDESKKGSDEPIVIEVCDSDTDEGEADGKKSKGGEKNKKRSSGESEKKHEGESKSPKDCVNDKEKEKKSTEKSQKQINDKNGKEETKKTDSEGELEKETEKQKSKSSDVNSEACENENGKSSEEKQEEDLKSRKKEKNQKKSEEDDEKSEKEVNDKNKKGSESERDEEKEGEEKDEQKDEEKDHDNQNQQANCDQTESSEKENEKSIASVKETEDSEKNKSSDEENKNSDESNSSDPSYSDKEEKTKRKTRQKKELKASFEKFKRKRQRFLNSKENTETEKKDEKEEKKTTNILDSSESETENKETEQTKNKKTKKRRILASSDEENDQKEEEDDEEEEEKEKPNSESDKEKSESEAPKLTSGESSTEEEEEKTKKRKRIKRQRDQNSDSSEEEKKKKKKKRTKSSSDSSEDEKEKKKKTKGRRNIKKILKKDSLQVETKEALKQEEERKKRVKERQKLFEELFPEEEGAPKTVILDFNPETKEPLVTVHKKLAKRLKPHQIKGIKFMWDNCFESVQKLEEDSGSGCILAHCMGLGKTLQVITLVHTVMTHDLGVNTVLVVCPLSTVSNWIREFEMWLGNIHTDPIILYDLLKYKKPDERVYQLKNWHEEGGVLVISYDLFRNLTKNLDKDGKKKKKKRIPKKQQVFESTLLDPGPDLVICDEGHLLKNVDTALSKCMNRLKTSRRIVLTGTPLQNNLVEYHCMVQFVKPNILGTRKEFCNRFVNPINNGQFEDSTELDVKIMKRRSHVLHSMLDGCVQRFDYSVLTPFLPEKHEYGVMISLTDTQAKAYMHFINNLSAKSLGSSRATSLFYDFNCLQRIWTHPRSILMQSERETVKEVCGRDSPGSLKDFVVSSSEEEEEGESGSESSGSSVQEIPQKKRLLRSNANDPEVQKAIEEEEKELKKRWWDEFYDEKSFDDLRESNKLVILFSLLKHCGEQKDKVLVFSQSLYSLDLIEYFLGKIDENRDKNDETLCGHTGRWELGSDYFRLDGSTSSDTRAIWCKYFNKESNTRARLFLISTRAGGLGINLYGANRVVIFDASWNPSHDLQSIFRVYRFGQKKPCFIYRFLAEGTMEEKIYERQVTKLSLAHRVVDEHQIERHYTMGNLQELYTFQPTPKEERKVPNVPKDSVLADLLTEHKEKIVSYHEHDSLLENKQEEVLSEEERKAAWKEYEEEKASKMINYNQMMEQMRMLQQGNMFQGMIEMGPQVLFPGQMNTGGSYMNPMYVSPNIPLEVMQRGLRVGVTPLHNEAVESYLSRIFQRECWLRGAQA